VNLTEKKIIGLLDMIPFFSREKKRDMAMNVLPSLLPEKKEEMLNDLKKVFQKLVSQVPLSAFINSDLPEKTKEKILAIENKYLSDMQSVQSKIFREFSAVDEKARQRDLEIAEALIQKELGI
jgi:hypothetical protein